MSTFPAWKEKTYRTREILNESLKGQTLSTLDAKQAAGVKRAKEKVMLTIN
jgi:hypothetical protein